MNIVRRYKLSLLKYNSLTEKELEDLNIIFRYINYSKENYEHIDFIYNNLFNLKEVYYKNSNYISWFKNDKKMFEYDLKYGMREYNKNIILYTLVRKYGYSYDIVRNLILDIIKDSYKIIL